MAQIQPTSSPVKGFAAQIKNYLEASSINYDSCIAETTHDLDLAAFKATVHLQYVKFDSASGEPKFDTLIKILVKHVVRFSLSVSTRAAMKRAPDFDADSGVFFLKARDYFRKIHSAGEVGELLLFFLLEAAFGAPQVVCKMELKTNRGDEVKGTDGVHVRWDEADDHLDVFLGEAKLYQNISAALKSAFESITEFYDLARLDDELHLVTAHYKHLDDSLKQSLLQFLDRQSAEHDCHIVQACLIGWDWHEYKKLTTPDRDAFVREFEETYRRYGGQIQEMLKNKLGNCKHKHLTFKFLFVPFKDVDEFRRAFYKELCGLDLPTSEAKPIAPRKKKDGLEPANN